MHPILPEQFCLPLAVTEPECSVTVLKQLNLDFTQWLQQQFDSLDTLSLVNARAHFIDLVLTKLWCQYQLDQYQVNLVAVGGYGRAELHPHSDIDILILTADKIDHTLEQKIGSFITALWDIKLDVGHSVRSVKECIKQAVNDVTIATNLMEMRSITGYQALSEQLTPLLHEEIFWPSKAFFIAKRDEQKKRHQQFRGASYTLEPNIKANPGGLRDIQTIAWVAKRHFKANSLKELVQHNYLTYNEYSELLECQDYLWRMRLALHFTAKRSENRLLFDYQSDVAKMMGFGDDGKAAVERMMKRFFRIISRVSELNKMLLQHFEQAILNTDNVCEIEPINQDFSLANGLLKLNNPHLFMRPVKIMEMFLLIADNPQIKGLHSQTLRAMRNARRRFVGGLNDYAANREIFIKLFKHPRGLGLPLTLMHKHSMLGAYLPQWKNITGQMQFDLFHAYSVDEHSFRLLKNLYRFSQVEHNHEFPLCSKIVQRIRKPELLYLAGVFHDIAKGRGGDHAKLGAQEALAFGKMHQLTDHDSRMIAWLVEQHLTMSVTAQRRDINDATVIKQFAEIVRDEARLDYLYCLTVADMRATNESLWNSWKANLLEELYFNTKRAFRHGLEKPVDLRAKIRENQQQAMQLLIEQGIEQQQVAQLWQEFKADYFLRYAPSQIAWHSQHMLSHNREKALVLIGPTPYRGGTEVFVFAKETDNIFANTVTLLSNKKLSILDAKIITSKSGFTLNTFVILDQRGKAINDEYQRQDIAQSIAQQLSQIGSKLIHFTAKMGTKKLAQFTVPVQVSFLKTHAKKYNLIEIQALDQPGLLSKIAQVFAQANINIHSAKITTFGERAEDVFTISSKQGTALTEHQQQQLEQFLLNQLDNHYANH